MPRKRNELLVGSWENITERSPGAKVRVCPYAREELTAWLWVHLKRYALAACSLVDAKKHGASVDAALTFNENAVSILCELIRRVPEHIPLKDWHTACNLAADDLRDGVLLEGEKPLAEQERHNQQESAHAATGDSGADDLPNGKQDASGGRVGG